MFFFVETPSQEVMISTYNFASCARCRLFMQSVILLLVAYLLACQVGELEPDSNI